MGQLFQYSHRMGRKPKDIKRDEFGAWLQYLRREARLSQEEVAMALQRWIGKDVGSSTICHWERKGNLANRKLIPALAKIYGVSVDVLLRTDKVEPLFKPQPRAFKEYKSGKEARKALGKLNVYKDVMTDEELEAFRKKSLKEINPHAR